ncbi:M15 family metallopeptidase [Legionella sp.]|uniref:M15 family metallopeptidase n=1 Tax=Legionella sp. TaxID=459 RepID=UPI000CBF274A|nr:M15 family metallopeptidase [Legionella sp.]PJE13556.1 MAG: D-alanyl-D-alanine dipeptidase [Legionella sp.]
MSDTLPQNFSENEFEVVEFTNNIHPRISIRPMYFELGFSPSPFIYGRAAVLQRLLKAIDFLPPKYGLLIWDVYRPRAIQAIIFEWMSQEIQKKFPHLSQQENYEKTKKFASPPAKVGDQYCPPHLSGGAIDLTLCDASSGEELDLGTTFDDCSERAHRDYFDQLKHLTPKDKLIKERRKLLQDTLENVGFTSYPYEWWHFDFGNLFWSRIHHCSELFGPLFGDREWPI